MRLFHRQTPLCLWPLCQVWSLFSFLRLRTPPSSFPPVGVIPPPPSPCTSSPPTHNHSERNLSCSLAAAPSSPASPPPIRLQTCPRARSSLPLMGLTRAPSRTAPPSGQRATAANSCAARANRPGADSRFSLWMMTAAGKHGAVFLGKSVRSDLDDESHISAGIQHTKKK